MKTTILKTFTVMISLVGLALTSQAQSVTYNGSIGPATLGANVTTTLSEFNSGLGTLTAVQLTLDFTVTPFATVGNFTSVTNLTFSPADSISYSFRPTIGNWTVTYGGDSWPMTAPTVTTGPIYGGGQSIPYYFSSYTELQLNGSTSAPADLTDASGSDLAAYVGGGDLVFGVTGPGYVSITDGALFGGGSGNLAGTASVTYDYIAVPEPTTMGLVAIGLLGALTIRRRKA